MEDVKTNRSHKSSFFTSLFSEKKRLLELYNALKGTSYDDPDMIDINTLSNAFFYNRQNDISFTIGGKFVVLIEHQSTPNENIPLRILIYIGRIYEKIVDTRNIYRRNLIKIPKPEFIVLYNGTDDFPDEKILKLSDAFEQGEIPQELQHLELQVRVVNINKGRNPELERKSESLSAYSEFISMVRGFEGRGFDLDESIVKTINHFTEQNILLDYLQEHTSEIRNMLFHEFNMDDALAVAKEEGREEILALVEKGYSFAEIKKQLCSNTAQKPPIQGSNSQNFGV